MRDFDQERQQHQRTDRRIRVGGRDFTYKASVAPEVVIRWNQATTGELGELSEEGWLALFDETILAILDRGQEEDWHAVRSPHAETPLNIGDMRAVLTYLLEEATGRPTGEPSGSSPGGDRIETPSRDESSSPAAPASTDSPPVRSAA